MSDRIPSDASATIGTIIDDTARRDAIHVAVYPAVAAHALRPGQNVGLYPDGRAGVLKLDDSSLNRSFDKSVVLIGVVDPFLKAVVQKGERFWLALYPRTVTSLRHAWTHPSFADETPSANQANPAEVNTSELWLRHFIATANCPDYDTVLNAAVGDHEKNKNESYSDEYFYSENDGEYLHFGGRDAHGEIPPEFWEHVQNVTGRKIAPENRAAFFSCSC